MMKLSIALGVPEAMPAGLKISGAPLVAALVVAAGGISPPAHAQERKPDERTRPNVVVIMTDDQTQDSMRYMPVVRRRIGGHGAIFPTTVTNWPQCCPSRATFLTGQYAHNHGVLGNLPPLGGFGRLDGANTLPVWLQAAGYYTAHIGKYLNGYEESPVGAPPGWTEWHGAKRTNAFYGYTLFEDGGMVEYGSLGENPDNPSGPGSYLSDVYTEKAVELITRRAPRRRPFFLSLAYLAPHTGGPNPSPPSRCDGTAKPAARHIGELADEPLPRPPSFDEDVSDKPSILARRPPLTREQVFEISRRYRCRGESLLAVDEGVGAILDALREEGELKRTLVIFTSDNGFFHGEHRVTEGKNRVYEAAIRVPLLMRGPGIRDGVSVDDITINADLAPTILDAARAKREATRKLDGRSLLRFARRPERVHGRELLIEQRGGDDDPETRGEVLYAAVRNARYTYVRNASGERELYDLARDPFQLENQVANPAYDAVGASLAARLAELQDCSGGSCRTKPALKLRLPRPVRRNGPSCRRPRRFVARVQGPDAGAVEEVVFRVGSKRDGTDQETPLKERIKAKRLRRKSRPEIRAIAQLIDRRKLSLQKRIRVCR